MPMNCIEMNFYTQIKHIIWRGDFILFFLLVGLFFIIFPIMKSSDISSIISGSLLGISLTVLSILTLIRQVSDGLKIKDHNITFRYNLKRTSIQLNNNLKVNMKTEIMKIRPVGTMGSDFINVIIFLQDQNIETPIFKFQMDKSNELKAKRLGKELKDIINSEFRQKFN